MECRRSCWVGVAMAFGLTVLTMAYAIGHISGCHLNPAVSTGLWAGGRFSANKLAPYIVARVLGGLVAGGVLFVIASGKVWLFWVAPIVGGVLGAVVYRLIAGGDE